MFKEIVGYGTGLDAREHGFESRKMWPTKDQLNGECKLWVEKPKKSVFRPALLKFTVHLTVLHDSVHSAGIIDARARRIN